jgi:hypothetical protein
MPITISTKGGVRLRGLDLLLALRRLEPQKAAVVLRELVAMGFTVGDLGISVAEIDRFVHGRPALRLIRGGKRSVSQSDSNPSVSGSSRNPTLESKNIERDESRITAAEHEFVERGSALPVEASLARDARSLGRAPDASLGYPRGSGSLRRSTQRVLIVAVVVRGLCGDSQPEARFRPSLQGSERHRGDPVLTPDEATGQRNSSTAFRGLADRSRGWLLD